MKSKIIFLLASLILSQTGFAKTSSEAICESLAEQAGETCRQSVCDDYRKDIGDENAKCEIDGDGMEIVQECATDELLSLVRKHNRENPAQAVGCEADGSVSDEIPAVASFQCGLKRGKSILHGEIYVGTLLASVRLADAKALGIRDMKQDRFAVVFDQVERKKEDSVVASKFYSDFSVAQGLEFSFPNDIVSGEKNGNFRGSLTVYDKSGDSKSAGPALSLECNAY